MTFYVAAREDRVASSALSILEGLQAQTIDLPTLVLHNLSDKWWQDKKAVALFSSPGNFPNQYVARLTSRTDIAKRGFVVPDWALKADERFAVRETVNIYKPGNFTPAIKGLHMLITDWRPPRESSSRNWRQNRERERYGTHSFFT